jgi:hypothetical protein
VSVARVIKPHGYFKVGDLIEIVDLMAHPLHPHRVEFLITRVKGWTIPRECIEWP